MEGTHKHLFTHCILIANDECKNLTGSSIKEEMPINLYIILYAYKEGAHLRSLDFDT